MISFAVGLQQSGLHWAILNPNLYRAPQLVAIALHLYGTVALYMEVFWTACVYNSVHTYVCMCINACGPVCTLRSSHLAVVDRLIFT